MKSILHYLIAFSSLAALLGGCFAWKDYPLPEPEPRLVVNGLFHPDSTWKIFVTSSLGTTDTTQLPPPVTDATVLIRPEDGDVFSLIHQGEGVYRSEQFPQPGILYELEVSAPGFPSVGASDRIPAQVEEISAYWDLSQKVPLVDDYGGIYTTFRVPIQFRDVAGQTNYYRLSFAVDDSFTYYNVLQNREIINPWGDNLQLIRRKTDDPAAEKVALKPGIFLLRDVSFQDQVKSTQLYLDTISVFRETLIGNQVIAPKGRQVRVYVDFRSLSENLFQYYLTYYTQSYGIGDPYATYTNVHTNIQNGYGIFAGYQRRLVLIYED